MVNKGADVHTDAFNGGGGNTGTFFLFFSVSAVFHLIFFVGLFFAPDFAPERSFSIAAINVNLVTLTDSEASRISRGKATIKTPEQAITQKAYKKPSKTVSLAPVKKKVKKSLKKKTFKSDKVVKKRHI